jgi:ligand-binding sensor domain-containing protein/signal transduction histidine kinase
VIKIRPLLVFLALLMATVLTGQRLPIKSFSSSQGLQGGGIGKILRDGHGFMWFCNSEGATRFDGYSFVRFGSEAGLPSQGISDILQTRDGCFWFATGQGLHRLDPAGTQRFKHLPVAAENPAVSCLLEDRQGVLWCGTATGLYRVDRSAGQEVFRFIDLGLPRKLWDDPIISALAEKADGGLWVGAGSGLFEMNPDGRVHRYGEKEGLPDQLIRSLVVEPDGTLWVGTRRGIAKIHRSTTSSHLGEVVRYSTENGLGNADVLTLLRAGDGSILAGTAAGLSILNRGPIQNLGPTQGVRAPVYSLAESMGGDLWLGNDSGVQCWTRSGLTTFTQADGLGDERVDQILEDRTGVLVASRARNASFLLQSQQGQRFQTAAVPFPAAVVTPAWSWNQPVLQDHLGDWWVATGQGLCRFDQSPSAAGISKARHVRTYKVAGAVGAEGGFAVFEDSRGDIWFSVASPVTNGLGRWRRREDRLEGFHERDGLPRLFDSLPTAFAEDQAGNVWVAFNGAGLARFKGGKFESIGKDQGVPEGWIRSLMVDSKGRLWVAASTGGAGLLEDPSAPKPRLRALTTAQGLASNSIWSFAEDAWGRIYIGTGAGVDRVDLAGQRVLHLSEAQGMAAGVPRTAYRSRDGALWFGLSGGLSRYSPTAPSATAPPPIYMTSVRVAGIQRTLPESGALRWDLLQLPPQENRIQVDFTSPGAVAGGALRYQYRLEGVADEWSAPGSGRSVDFANLAPGHYNFQVRAIGEEGMLSLAPAELHFSILPPVWMRWWFLALASGSLLGLLWLGYRSRLRHLLEVERIRTRIAADLHDDIGASLSRIAILSEVVKRSDVLEKSEATRFLTEIAESSRELVDSMGEIVWSIDPRRDDLRHLLARIGQFASGALEAKAIRWTMTHPPDPARVKLTPEQRRGTFLILKEAINNALKHSGCRTLNLLIEFGPGTVVAQIRDDGTGIPEGLPGLNDGSPQRGRGLANMQARAQEMGGHLAITSGPEGTVIRLELPHRVPRGA